MDELEKYIQESIKEDKFRKEWEISKSEYEKEREKAIEKQKISSQYEHIGY